MALIIQDHLTRSSPPHTPITHPRILCSNPSPKSLSTMVKPVYPSPLRESTLSIAEMSALCLDGGETSSSDACNPKAHSTSASQSSESATSPQEGVMIVTEPDESKSRNLETSTFVKGHEADDVFGSDALASTSSVIEANPVVQEAQSNADDTGAVANTKSEQPAPRADRIGDPITPANAQGLLLPEACVFVANLAMGRTDEQLEFSCHEAFDVFGSCIIKVRRDRHKHPFAMVQYYNLEDAARAVQGAYNLVVDGRRIRTEAAQAKRAVVLVKSGGGCPTVQEAHEMLGRYGPISKCHPTTHADARRFGLPAGIWVEFAYYLDYKDALRYFDTTSNPYRLHIPTDVGSSFGVRDPVSIVVPVAVSPRSTTDQKSIFLGNLPGDATELELREVFGRFGEIKAVNIIHKPLHGEYGFNVFAFVEYATAQEAEVAAQQEIDLRGQRIRVEPKEYSARRHTRLRQHGPHTPWSRTPYRGRASAYNSMSMQQNTSNPGYYTYDESYLAPQQINTYYQDAYHPDGYNTGYNMYQTPPPSSRAPRRNFVYNGSPHGMHMFSPAAPPFVPYGMESMHENMYGSYHMYQDM